MAKFIKSADLVDQYFYDNRNQFCFVGRSNAGKSSLINALANATLAKTSSSPGKTKLVNFFDFNTYVLVDLPGYGYAKTSKTTSEILNKIIYEYLTWAKKLVCVCQLCSIDVILESDLKIANELKMLSKKYNIDHLILLTKADKLNQNQIKNQVIKAQEFFKISAENILPISTKNKLNIKKLESIINAINLKHKHQNEQTR